MEDTFIRPMESNSPSLQQLVIHLFSLVTEVMAEDLALAESLRGALTSLWLAISCDGSLPSSEAIEVGKPLGSQDLMRLVRKALRGGYLSFDDIHTVSQMLRVLSDARRGIGQKRVYA